MFSERAFDIISFLSAAVSLHAAYFLLRRWRSFWDKFTFGDRQLAREVAFFIIVPLTVPLHELGHAVATWTVGGEVVEFQWRIFWGYIIPRGAFGSSQQWWIALAGNLVSVLVGALLIGVGYFRPALRRPLRALLLLSGLYVALFTLIGYPLLSFAGAFGDWRRIYDFHSTPQLSALTALVHVGLLAGLWLARRDVQEKLFAIENDLELAIEKWRAALRKDPCQPDKRIELADLFADRNAFHLAETTLRRGLKDCGDQPSLYLELGRRALQQRAYGAARFHLERGLGLEGLDHGTEQALWANLTSALLGSGMYAETVDAFAHLTEPLASDPRLRYLRGVANHKLGDKDSARSDFEATVSALGSEDRLGRLAAASLRELSGEEEADQGEASRLTAQPAAAEGPPASRRARALAALIVVGAAFTGAVLLDESRTNLRRASGPRDEWSPAWSRFGWRPVPPSPLTGRQATTEAWTGDEMLIWGGDGCRSVCNAGLAKALSDGAAYDPRSNRWRRLPPPPLRGRVFPASAWTGEEMLVWGGTDGRDFLGDGAAYRPDTNAWRKMSRSPLTSRAKLAAVWTGKKMIVWGGVHRRRFFADGATYSPRVDSWSNIKSAPLRGRMFPAAVWTGKEMVVWGGANGARRFADGAAYNPHSNRWRKIAPAPLSGRVVYSAIWTGRELLVWGEEDKAGHRGLAEGAAYNPATDAWRRLPPSPLLARGRMVAIWTGVEMVIWGGAGDRGFFDDGAAYNRATNGWRLLPPSFLSARAMPAAIWTGQEMIVWGGNISARGTASATDGARYLPGSAAATP